MGVQRGVEWFGSPPCLVFNHKLLKYSQTSKQQKPESLLLCTSHNMKQLTHIFNYFHLIISFPEATVGVRDYPKALCGQGRESLDSTGQILSSLLSPWLLTHSALPSSHHILELLPSQLTDSGEDPHFFFWRLYFKVSLPNGGLELPTPRSKVVLSILTELDRHLLDLHF